MLPTTGKDAPNEGHKQQHVNRGEPHRREDIIELEFVVDFTHATVVGNVLVHFVSVE